MAREVHFFTPRRAMWARRALDARPRARRRGGRARARTTTTTMRNRVLFEPREVDERTRTVRLDGSDSRARHVRDVLKAGEGARLRVGTVDVGKCEATIERVDEDGGMTVVLDPEDERAEVPRVDVLLATPRPKVLRRLWAPLASLGVGRVVLTNANKVERYYFDSKAFNPETIRGEILRGLEQAGDYAVPQIGVAKRLPPVIDRLAGVLGDDEPDTNGFEWLLNGDDGWDRKPDVLLLAHPEVSPTSMADALAGADSNSRVVIAVGPEGGWTKYELELFENAGFKRVGLGSRTFTTDVACISLVSAVRERLQNWL